MNDITLMIGSEEQFFERGRALARSVDLGKQIVKQNIRSFEDPHDLESFKKELAENARQSGIEYDKKP